MKGRPQIVSLQPNSLADIWEDIRRVAAALGIAERGEAVDRRACRARMIATAGPRHAARAARGLHRMDRAADGGGELDARS